MGGHKTWVNGDALTGPDVQGYLMNQAVMVFASTAARDAALTSPTEGMLTYQTDTHTYTTYTGAAWAEQMRPGALTAYTPTTPNISVGDGTLIAAYARIGRWVQVRISFAFGTTTTIASNAQVQLPVTPLSTANQSLALTYFDSSAAQSYSGGGVVNAGSGYIDLVSSAGRFSNTVPITWANSDGFYISGAYEANA